MTEGTSYSGRLKYLLLCNSVLVSHKLDWSEFSSHLLQPDGPEQNFVQTEQDWSDLRSKMESLLAHPEEANLIAKRGYEHFHQLYTTPAAVGINSVCRPTILADTSTDQLLSAPSFRQLGQDTKLRS